MLYTFIDKIKANYWVVLMFSVLISFVANYLGSKDIVFLFLFISLLVGTLVLYVIYFNPLYAMVLNWMSSFVLGFIVFLVLKITVIPLGVLFEALNFLGLAVLFFRRELTGGKTLIGKLLLFWLLICCFELVNPFAASRVAWFFAIRQLLFIIIPFFVVYSLFVTNRLSLKFLLTTWLVFSTLAALYTLYQEFIGIPDFQYNTFAGNEKLMSLLVTFGRLRKMSFFPGPMDNGMVLALNAVLCLGLAFEVNISRIKQLFYLVLMILSALAMIYTGTRTATVLFVFGAGIYIIFSRRKELIILSILVAFLLAGYIGATGGGGALFVMTTAFNPEEDPSMIVRYNNQMLLRGYLYKSPIGYGLGSTGFIGEKFSPYTFLGSFPPDSELVRIVIETGIIGLGIYLYIMFLILKVAINSVSLNESAFSSNFKMVIVALLFMFLLGQYPQEILNVSPLKIFFAFLLAYISLDQKHIDELTY